MKIELIRLVEYYNVEIPEGEEDPGSYAVRREPLQPLDFRYEVFLISGKDKQAMISRSRPYRNISKAIEQMQQEEQKRLLERQARFLGDNAPQL